MSGCNVCFVGAVLWYKMKIQRGLLAGWKMRSQTRPIRHMRRYPVEMRDISERCYQERKDEALTLIYREAVSKYYDFTYNQLYIGRGIERMLQQLETRYGLNFSELEKEYTARNSGHNPPVE